MSGHMTSLLSIARSRPPARTRAWIHHSRGPCRRTGGAREIHMATSRQAEPTRRSTSMPAYVLFDNLEVTDPGALAEYFPQAAKIVAAHGGRYLAVDAVPEVMEGDPGLKSLVLMEFPDVESVRAWYDSPEYSPLKAIRHRA